QRQQARFQADERDRVARAHGAPEDLAGIRIQAARNIQRQHGAGLRIDEVDEFSVLALDRAREADAEQAVDDQVPADVLRDIFGSCYKANPEESFLQSARKDLRVAAVV